MAESNSVVNRESESWLYSDSRLPASSASSDVTLHVKNNSCYRARFQASYVHLDNANWPGKEAGIPLLLNIF